MWNLDKNKEKEKVERVERVEKVEWLAIGRSPQSLQIPWTLFPDSLLNKQ